MGIEFEERLANEYAIRKGVERGFAEGEAKGKLETARKMKAKGIDYAVISECTNLTAEQIAAL